MRDHENHHFIEELFYRQVRALSLQGHADVFDLQFSDGWLA